LSQASLFMILGIAGLVGIFLLFCVAMVGFAFYKHNQYMKFAKSKIKVKILPVARAEYSIIVDKGFSSNVLAVPTNDQNTLPRYFYDKENLWASPYPEKPFLGLGFLQVQIDTLYVRENNPDPITCNPLTPLLTANSMYAAIEEEMELLIKKVSTTIASLEKKLLEALTTKLNKYVVYFFLVLIILVQVVGLIYTIQVNSHVTALNNMWGVK
jgi:hypothetical protein